MGVDPQQTSAYKWEREVLASYTRRVTIDQARTLVAAVWMAEGLRFPPAVESMPKQVTTALGDATRTKIRLVGSVPEWVVLHEVAHSMQARADVNETDYHGKLWLGTYMRLLEKFMGVPMPLMMYTATRAGLEYDIAARPMFME